MSDVPDIAAEVARLAARPIPPTPIEHPRHTLEALALYDRCRGLFGAVRHLAGHGFGQEALILTRPMYTEALMLLELASVDEPRRVELIIGYCLASTADFEGVMREAQTRGDDASAELDAIAERWRHLEDYARRRGVRTRHWSVNEKQLADKHLRGEGYLDFRTAHHFVHGSAFAFEQRYSRDGDIVMVGGPATSQDWTRGALGSASQSMLYAVRGICGVLGKPEPEPLRDLVRRLDEADKAQPGGTVTSGE